MFKCCGRPHAHPVGVHICLGTHVCLHARWLEQPRNPFLRILIHRRSNRCHCDRHVISEESDEEDEATKAVREAEAAKRAGKIRVPKHKLIYQGEQEMLREMLACCERRQDWTVWST